MGAGARVIYGGVAAKKDGLSLKSIGRETSPRQRPMAPEQTFRCAITHKLIREVRDAVTLRS